MARDKNNHISPAMGPAIMGLAQAIQGIALAASENSIFNKKIALPSGGVLIFLGCAIIVMVITVNMTGNT